MLEVGIAGVLIFLFQQGMKQLVESFGGEVAKWVNIAVVIVFGLAYVLSPFFADLIPPQVLANLETVLLALGAILGAEGTYRIFTKVRQIEPG